MSENSRATGLEARYVAEKIDDPEGKHRECAYFVLDPQHDPIARVALLTYSIRARMEGYTLLADDLDTWLNDVRRGDPVSEPVELTEAERDLAESLVACECGHGLDTHNGLGCYARLSYDPVMTCLCVLTDDRTDAELLALRLPAYVVAREAAARREALLEAAELGLANGYLTIAGADFLEDRADKEEPS